MQTWILAHLGFLFIVVISLISCSSRKEKLGSNTPISFITSCRFSPEAGPLATSGDFADSSGFASLTFRSRNEKNDERYSEIRKKGQLNKVCRDEVQESFLIYCEAYLVLLLLQLVLNQLESVASFCHDLYGSSQAL